MNYKNTLLYIIEPFYGMFRKTFLAFFGVDALFILGLYIVKSLGVFLSSFSENIVLALTAVISLTILILVNYTFCKSLQYKKIEKRSKYHEILGKHLFIAIILGIFMFIVLGFAAKIIEIIFQVVYIQHVQRFISIVVVFYTYLLFLNSHNHDHHPTIKAIWHSAKTLKWKTVIKILYFDSVYIFIVYLIHNLFIFLFQYLLIFIKLPVKILDPVYAFIEGALAIILLIAILAMNKIIVYEIDNERKNGKSKKKKFTKKAKTKK